MRCAGIDRNWTVPFPFLSGFPPCKIKQNNLVINGAQDGRNS
jgi:hypothetical protein